MADSDIERQFHIAWVEEHGHPPTRDQGELYHRELEAWHVKHLVDHETCMEALEVEMAKTGLTVADHAEKRPGEHLWMKARGIVSCCICGVCRRGDGLNRPCQGVVRIALRGAS